VLHAGILYHNRFVPSFNSSQGEQKCHARCMFWRNGCCPPEWRLWG